MPLHYNSYLYFLFSISCFIGGEGHTAKLISRWSDLPRGRGIVMAGVQLPVPAPAGYEAEPPSSKLWMGDVSQDI